MTSPFSTFEEFSSAEGPIYTFANNPTMIAILLIISALISIYFFYASFAIKQESSKSPDVAALGVLLVAGFASIMGTLLNPQADRREAVNPRPSHEMRTERSGWQPLALLGLVGLGGSGAAKSRSKRRTSRKVRRIQ
jgi:hypothetical protein